MNDHSKYAFYRSDFWIIAWKFFLPLEFNIVGNKQIERIKETRAAVSEKLIAHKTP